MHDKPSKIRQEVEALLGYPVAGSMFSQSILTGTQNLDDWVLEDWLFTTNLGEDVPGTFHRPRSTDKPVPAVLYCHAHGNRYDFGKDELMLGRPSLQDAYGPALRNLGIASLCLEMPAFGARQRPNEQTRAKAHLWHGTTLFGQMLVELSAGLSFLAEQPDLDSNRLGTLGFSMGSTHAWWLAALDERVTAAAALCSFADLETLIATGDHNGHGIYMTVPGLVSSFSSGELAGLAAPRALMIGVGMKDWSTPQNCFQPARSIVEAAYQGSTDKLHVHIEQNHGHEETPAMRSAVLEFLTTHLGAAV